MPDVAQSENPARESEFTADPQRAANLCTCLTGRCPAQFHRAVLHSCVFVFYAPPPPLNQNVVTREANDVFFSAFSRVFLSPVHFLLD